MSDFTRNGLWHSAAAIVAVGIAAAGALVAWGGNSMRLGELEQRSDKQAAHYEQLFQRVEEDEKTIAVTQAEYEEILRRLDNIDRAIGADDLSQGAQRK